MKTVSLLITLACLVGTSFSGCGENQRPKIEKTQSQIHRIAEELDRKTTDTGAYLRVEDNAIQEVDPWGTRIQIVYAQGGVAETITVRSAGPDGEFHTRDDIQALKFSANLSGVGTGIAKHAEETASSAAKGVVKGVVSGVKESLKESLSKRASSDLQSDTDNDVQEKL